MITLTVTSFHGSAYTGAPLSASFGETGGTIGRAEGNLLVLPDPERTISRVHAQVAWRGGQFVVQDRGSNPIAVNGQVLSTGGEQALRPGDEVLIGGFCLRVAMTTASPESAARAAPPAPDDDIFAGLFGAHGGGSDPLQNPFAAPPPTNVDAGRWAARAPGGNHPLAAPQATGRPGGGIPDDWDPFGTAHRTRCWQSPP